MHGPTRLGSIARRHSHTITQQDAPSPQLVTSHGWKRLIVELLSFDAALTATPAPPWEKYARTFVALCRPGAHNA
jgi:hypothetical protein